MLIGVISEQKTNYSETGGHVLTPFFDTCQGWWYCEEGAADLKETKTCIVSGSVDWVTADGPKEYSRKMLICAVW